MTVGSAPTGANQGIAEKPSTGRGVKHRRPRTTECLRLDLAAIRCSGGLQPPWGRGAFITWKGRPTSLAFIVLGDAQGPRAIAIGEAIGECLRATHGALLTRTPCPFGGRRYWFRCPLALDDHACNRRCRILYRPPGAEYFGCRVCHGLTYESRQRHRERFYEGFQKPMAQLQALEPRLRRARNSRSQRKVARRVLQACEAMARYNGSSWPLSPAVRSKLDLTDG